MSECTNTESCETPDGHERECPRNPANWAHDGLDAAFAVEDEVPVLLSPGGWTDVFGEYHEGVASASAPVAEFVDEVTALLHTGDATPDQVRESLGLPTLGTLDHRIREEIEANVPKPLPNRADRRAFLKSQRRSRPNL